MVKVSRHASISIRYLDEKGEVQEMKQLDRAVSELLQHEIDHLDGVLAIDRALDKNSIISRAYYQQHKTQLDQQVDFFIVPTIQTL